MSAVDKQNLLKNIRRVAIDGFTGPNLAMLEYCLSSAVDCELVNSVDADIVILNGDQPVAEVDLQKKALERYSGSKIVISVKDLEWPGFILLKKPHTSDQLLATIRSIKTAIGQNKEKVVPESKGSSVIQPENLDFYRGGKYSRKRQGEALKQKLMRGNLVVNAADRLVQKIEIDLKAQEAELQAKLEEEKRKQVEREKAKRKEQKIRELKKKKLEEKRLEAKRKKLAEEKARKLEEKKKQLAEEKATKLKQQLKEHQRKKQQAKALKQRQIEVKKKKNKEDSRAAEVATDAPLTEQIILQRCGNLADVDMTQHEERRRIFLNPEGLLLGTMKEAEQLSKKLERVVEISGLPGKMLVSAEAGEFYFTFADDFLNQLSLTKFGFAELELEPLEDTEFDAGEFSSEAVDSLLWKVAIWTARGKIFQGMDPEKVLQLKTQPDFTRFIMLPSGKEISDLWSGHQLSALDVVRILDIPQRYVFSFMSGAFLLGWFQE
ncbi:hypothetical protein [Neptuniibacter sp.]|uniref:hypothetical protein n=1 Tax=Neptuniibacter sp. TaxID=1962643 RepID=UPI002627744A|nr:hypothetical protein [Neptuniibacter sp.]MCP4595792.1 hypothetical protein [Neptuniibacter sp.]